MRIETRSLTYRYRDGRLALDGIDLAIEGDDPVAIIGQNGAGKTTLVKHFNGILRPTSGSVLVDGRDIGEQTASQWAATVGYVFQNPDNQLFLETVKDELEFGPRQLRVGEEEIERRMRWVAELVGMDGKLGLHPADLSQTEKKFCAMGAVIMMDPQAVVLDEPTCGQDVGGLARLEEVIRTLRRRGKLCIAISHDTKFVARCFPRTVVMCRGKVLAQGDTREVFSQVDVLRESFVIPPPVARVSRAVGMGRIAFEADELIESVVEKRKEEGR